jgi:type III secretion regulatory protein HpaA
VSRVSHSADQAARSAQAAQDAQSAQATQTTRADARRRRLIRARSATLYGRYATRFAYANGAQSLAAAARNQMLGKLKPRLKTSAPSRRRKRADSENDTPETDDEDVAVHVHVAGHDEHERRGSGQGGQGGRGGQQQRERGDGRASVLVLPRVRKGRARAATAAPARLFSSLAAGLADGSERERALRHLWADTLLQLGRRAEAEPGARLNAAVLAHQADLLTARLRSGPLTPIGWQGVKQLLIDATGSAPTPRQSGADGARVRSHRLLLPLLLFQIERPSTQAQTQRAFATVETLRRATTAASGEAGDAVLRKSVAGFASRP